ncbi:MAG: radical SAM protein, partial [Clostridia bacterium]|nr:radical SAM protein [Clostridia bacterium]
MKKILQDLSYGELENLILSLGEKKFRAKQLYDGLVRGKNISSINISPTLRESLLKDYEDEPVKIIETLTSSDGTEKYLMQLADGNIIESVFMRYNYGNTQCVSTQVGCRMGCKFCASTLGGLVRNLSSGEILCEVLTVNALHGGYGAKRAVTNIVLMGSGEPLDNYENVIKFLRSVSDENGINVSPRNISLSTCGIVPKIYDLAEEGLPVNLTVSLHSPTDEC